MKRRTLLQGVLAFVGLSRFVQAKPVQLVALWTGSKTIPEPTIGDANTFSPDMEVLIEGMCRSIILNEMKKNPPGRWGVSVIRSSYQPEISHVYLYNEINKPGYMECWEGRFGFHRPTMFALSDAEQIEYLREWIQTTMTEDMTCMYNRILPNANL